MNCLHCLAENPDGAKFCGKCGQSLAPPATSGGTGGQLDNVFKWVGIIVSILFALALLSSC
jgi:hypothetical protein